MGGLVRAPRHPVAATLEGARRFLSVAGAAGGDCRLMPRAPGTSKSAESRRRIKAGDRTLQVPLPEVDLVALLEAEGILPEGSHVADDPKALGEAVATWVRREIAKRDASRNENSKPAPLPSRSNR